MLPHCKITIYDNESTDSSVAIAKSLGCKVISWSSNGINNVYLKRGIANTSWKSVKDGWVIMCDMDEWLCVTEKDLIHEKNIGTTILKVEGYNMVGKSQQIDLHDINLHEIKEGALHTPESKNLCFLRPDIKEINYTDGAHESNPVGRIQYSSVVYVNKHMSELGLPFIQNKMINRYKRSTKMRKEGKSTHYTNNLKKIKRVYTKTIKKSHILKCNKKGYCYTRKNRSHA